MVQAHEHFEQGIKLLKAQNDLASPLLYGHNNGIGCENYASWNSWLLGYPDRALQHSLTTINRANALDHPFSLVFALCWAASLHQFRREDQAALERAEAVIALSQEHGFVQWLNWGKIVKGWAAAIQGNNRAGIELIRIGLDNWRAIPLRTTLPYFLALLAEVFGGAGQIEAGLETITQALAVVQNSGERFWQAGLYRLRGKLLLAEGSPQAVKMAETCFLQAIDLAQAQQARSLELRAMVSLSSLPCAQRQPGQVEEATQHLSERLDWFSEGFDTPDLQAAQTLRRQSTLSNLKV